MTLQAYCNCSVGNSEGCDSNNVHVFVALPILHPLGLFINGAKYKLEHFFSRQPRVYSNIAFLRELAKLEARYSNMESKVIWGIFTV